MVNLNVAIGGEDLKIRLEVDDQANEPEITIRANSPQVANALATAFQNATPQYQQIALRQRGQNYQIALQDILFFEATDHQVMAHTADQVFNTRQRLYELADELPANFQRVSKSAILNWQQIFSLTKSVTGNLVRFKHSHKQLYVSRRYYQALKLALERKG